MFSITVSNLWEFCYHSELSWSPARFTVPTAVLKVAGFNSFCWGTGCIWNLDAVLSQFNHTSFVSFSSIGALGKGKSGMFQGLNNFYLQKSLTVKGKETIQMCLFLDSSGLWYMLLYLAPYGFYKPSNGNGAIDKK